MDRSVVDVILFFLFLQIVGFRWKSFYDALNALLILSRISFPIVFEKVLLFLDLLQQLLITVDWLLIIYEKVCVSTSLTIYTCGPFYLSSFGCRNQKQCRVQRMKKRKDGGKSHEVLNRVVYYTVIINLFFDSIMKI